MTPTVNVRRALDLIYFSFNDVGAVHVKFSKAFNAVSHNIHASKFGICSLSGRGSR